MCQQPTSRLTSLLITSLHSFYLSQSHFFSLPLFSRALLQFSSIALACLQPLFQTVSNHAYLLTGPIHKTLSIVALVYMNVRFITPASDV